MIRMVQANLKAGSLHDDSYWPTGQITWDQPEFANVKIEGPWPDVLEYYFRCVGCSTLYRLSCEVYHGRGGEWSLVGDVDAV